MQQQMYFINLPCLYSYFVLVFVLVLILLPPPTPKIVFPSYFSCSVLFASQACFITTVTLTATVIATATTTMVQVFGVIYPPNNNNNNYNHNSQSISNLCSKIGLPSWVVDIRHNASHQELPSSIMLRLSCSLTLLEFMIDKYWFVIIYPSHSQYYRESLNQRGTGSGVVEESDKGDDVADGNDDEIKKNDNMNRNCDIEVDAKAHSSTTNTSNNNSSSSSSDWNYLTTIEAAVRSIMAIEQNPTADKNSKSKSGNRDNNKKITCNNKKDNIHNKIDNGDDNDNGDNNDGDNDDDDNDNMAKYGAYSIFMEKKKDKKLSKKKKMILKKKKKEKQKKTADKA